LPEKLQGFLRHAASAGAPLILKTDDDVLLNIRRWVDTIDDVSFLEEWRVLLTHSLRPAFWNQLTSWRLKSCTTSGGAPFGGTGLSIAQANGKSCVTQVRRLE
jgi:hypothetical protein